MTTRSEFEVDKGRVCRITIPENPSYKDVIHGPTHHSGPMRDGESVWSCTLEPLNQHDYRNIDRSAFICRVHQPVVGTHMDNKAERLIKGSGAKKDPRHQHHAKRHDYLQTFPDR